MAGTPDSQPADTAGDRRRVLLAVGVARGLLGFWEWADWPLLVIAMSAFIARPRRERTRGSAFAPGLAVAFGMVVLLGWLRRGQ